VYITVYITKTGERYHEDGCRSLSRSKIATTLARAKLTLTPCQVCYPPRWVPRRRRPWLAGEWRAPNCAAVGPCVQGRWRCGAHAATWGTPGERAMIPVLMATILRRIKDANPDDVPLPANIIPAWFLMLALAIFAAGAGLLVLWTRL